MCQGFLVRGHLFSHDGNGVLWNMIDCSGVREDDRRSFCNISGKKATAIPLHIDKCDSDACLLFSSLKIKALEWLIGLSRNTNLMRFEMWRSQRRFLLFQGFYLCLDLHIFNLVCLLWYYNTLPTCYFCAFCSAPWPGLTWRCDFQCCKISEMSKIFMCTQITKQVNT